MSRRASHACPTVASLTAKHAPREPLSRSLARAVNSKRMLMAAMVVPIALFSAAASVFVAKIGGVLPTTLLAVEQVVVPDAPIEVVANYSNATGEVDADTDADTAIADAAREAIPAIALLAYQKAAAVVDQASSCNLDWTFLAAIGRIESNHGRTGGRTLGADGVPDSPIIGVALDGGHGTAVLRDTDGGLYDGDSLWDHAVGPMQFIPSTWVKAGVDGDGDGLRNPQDIDDASLAAAAYLCSGGRDLSTLEGQKAAAMSYNRSESYAVKVIGIASAYAKGDFSSITDAYLASRGLTLEDLSTMVVDPDAGSGGAGTVADPTYGLPVVAPAVDPAVPEHVSEAEAVQLCLAAPIGQSVQQMVPGAAAMDRTTLQTAVAAVDVQVSSDFRTCVDSAIR